MSQYGPAVIALSVEAECKRQGINLNDDSIDGPLWCFSMHMAFDPEYSIKLQVLVEDYGWKIVSRELPTLYNAMDTDEQALDHCVNTACHYKQELMTKLTHMWLARD